MTDSKNIQARKKQYENTLLHIIRTETYTSRSSLKTASGLSMETVLSTVDRLLKEELIYESGVENAPVGRKPTWLAINPSGRYCIGIKFSSLVICGAVLNFEGKVETSIEKALPTDISPKDLLSLLFLTIRSLLDWLGERQDRVCGIGIGCPGVVDRKSGVLIRYIGVKGMTNIPLKRMIEAEFGIETTIDQSLKAAAVAYKNLPENANIKDMLYVLVKSGVGMTVIVNNEVFAGLSNAAGEIGHIRVRKEGKPCYCGKSGCLESEIGYAGIARKISDGIAQGRYPLLRQTLPRDAAPTIKDFVAAVAMDDPDAHKDFREICNLLGEVIVNSIATLNPQLVIFSGELTVIPGFLDFMQHMINDCCPIEASRNVRLYSSVGGDLFDATGAAMMVLHHNYGVRRR
ncbi:MAG: ROK family protein [Eubacteriales bacterium]|nr:ROK family protein [Eubacteriales bacterium]